MRINGACHQYQYTTDGHAALHRWQGCAVGWLQLDISEHIWKNCCKKHNNCIILIQKSKGLTSSTDPMHNANKCIWNNHGVSNISGYLRFFSVPSLCDGDLLYRYNADISVLIFSTKSYLRCIHKTILFVNDYQKFSIKKYWFFQKM